MSFGNNCDQNEWIWKKWYGNVIRMIKFRMTVWIGNLHYLILNTGKLIRMTEFGKKMYGNIFRKMTVWDWTRTMKFRLWIHNQGIGEWNSINVNMQPFPKAKTKFIQLLYSHSQNNQRLDMSHISTTKMLFMNEEE